MAMASFDFATLALRYAQDERGFGLLRFAQDERRLARMCNPPFVLSVA